MVLASCFFLLGLFLLDFKLCASCNQLHGLQLRREVGDSAISEDSF